MSNSWWASKLGGQQNAPQQPYTPPTAPQVQPRSYPAVNQPSGLEGHVLPQSAIEVSRCPNCSSGNYGKMPGMPEVQARCYDCGYPRTQSGTGMPGVHLPSNGNTVAATQISTANNFNPNTIIDRIG